MSGLIEPSELRHQIHSYPELMFDEIMTTRLLVENISKISGVTLFRPLETGLLVEYRVNEGGFLLFRADIDALPIKEETGISYSSQNNYMHACGHDVHTSILYGFLRYAVENKVNRNILFLFQPGEEGGGGAEKIIKSGILNNYTIDNAFALHVTDEYKLGEIASSPGTLFASAFELDIEFTGKSAHVAFPENGKNAFEALVLFLGKVKNLVKQEEERVIFGYGKIESGSVRNIVPGHAKIEATLRALSRNKCQIFLGKINELLNDVEKETGVMCKLTTGSLYTEVVVDKTLYEQCRKILSGKYEFIDCGYKMTGEDFGFISKLYPSFMFWLGTCTGEQFGLHNPKFLPEDSIINTGIEIYKAILNEV